jgi:hypothetical protein
VDATRRELVRELVRGLHDICARVGELVRDEEDGRAFDAMQQAVELLVSAIMALEDAIETGPPGN